MSTVSAKLSAEAQDRHDRALFGFARRLVGLREERVTVGISVGTNGIVLGELWIRLGKLWIRGVLPPSLNVWQRMHWTARRRLQKSWDARICVETLRASVPRVPRADHTRGEKALSKRAHRRAISIVRIGRRLLDADNLAASLKVVLDALKHARVIVDDSPRWLELHVAQRVAQKGEPVGLAIEISTPAPAEGAPQGTPR